MRSTPRHNPNTLSSVTGTNPPHGQHDPNSPDQPVGWYTQPLPPTTPPPDKSMSTGRLLAVIFAAVAAVCVVAGIGAALAPSPKDDKPAVSGTTNEALPAQTATPTTAAATSTAPAAPVGPKTSFGDGTWEIGAAAGQVAPGKYRTTVPTTSSNCYWERLKGTSGGFDDIIANDNADPGTPTVVTIGAQDVAFKSRGCGTWAKA